MNLAVRPHFLGLLLLVLVVVGIERLIVTDEEAIEGVATQISEAIQAGRFEDLEPLLHPDFEFRGKDRAETIAYVRQVAAKYKPLGGKVVLTEIEVEEDTAKAKGVVAGTVYGRPQQIRIDATFERSPDDEWLLRSVGGAQLPR